MKTFKRFLLAATVFLAAISCKEEVNHNYMWFDCEANYATLSHPDSIKFYHNVSESKVLTLLKVELYGIRMRKGLIVGLAVEPHIVMVDFLFT